MMASKPTGLLVELPKQEHDFKNLNELNDLNFDLTKLLLTKINSLNKSSNKQRKSRSGSINELPPNSPTKCLNELNFYKTKTTENQVDIQQNDEDDTRNQKSQTKNDNKMGKLLQIKRLNDLLYLNASLYNNLPTNIQEQFELDSQYSSSSDPSSEWMLDDQAFVLQALNRHNYYRKMHNVPNLMMSKNLINYSKDWVEILARNDRLEKRYANRFGENVFVMQLDDQSSSLNGAIPVDHWYAKGLNYDYTNEHPKASTNEFTQTIWKGSKWFGCACAKSNKSNRIYVVASYSQPGNFPHTYLDNVLKPVAN